MAACSFGLLARYSIFRHGHEQRLSLHKTKQYQTFTDILASQKWFGLVARATRRQRKSKPLGF